MPSDRTISLQYQQRHKLYSRRTYRTYLIAINKTIADAKAALPDLNAYRQAVHNLPTQHIKQALFTAYKSVIQTEGQYTLNEIKANIQQKDLFDATFWRTDWLEYLQVWLQKNAGVKIASITNTLRNRLLRILEETYSENASLSNQERAALIYAKLNDPAFTRQRVLVIARTETTTATNLAHVFAAESVTDRLNMRLEKRWIATADKRTRDAHRAMLNYPAIGENDDFVVGGELMAQPGDSRASAKEVVNCRCRVIYRAVRGADGRILPK